jgi:endonuclease YncB( thermonuclease family)
VRHPVDVIRTIDGDTFEARVHLWSGFAVTTRLRLRGIDATELKASCPKELQMPEAAGDALRGLLDEGEVTIYNIGPDKYNGRFDADVATRRTENVSAALLAAGHARPYSGGHRSGWCVGVANNLSNKKSGAEARLFPLSDPGAADQRDTTTVVPTETR